MFCKNCGTKLSDNDKFCEYCGTKFSVHAKESVDKKEESVVAKNTLENKLFYLFVLSFMLVPLSIVLLMFFGDSFLPLWHFSTISLFFIQFILGIVLKSWIRIIIFGAISGVLLNIVYPLYF